MPTKKGLFVRRLGAILVIFMAAGGAAAQNGPTQADVARYRVILAKAPVERVASLRNQAMKNGLSIDEYLWRLERSSATRGGGGTGGGLESSGGLDPGPPPLLTPKEN